MAEEMGIILKEVVKNKLIEKLYPLHFPANPHKLNHL